MAGDNLAIAIDQDRHVEAECLDAGGDLPDLPFAVTPRVRGIRFELFVTPFDDLQAAC